MDFKISVENKSRLMIQEEEIIFTLHDLTISGSSSNNFQNFIKVNSIYVDKTKLIEWLIDNQFHRLHLTFTFPNKWGKSLNLSMIRHFFDSESIEKGYDVLFKGGKLKNDDHEYNCLHIGHNWDKYVSEFGQYTVILLNMKDLCFTNLNTFKISISHLIYNLYGKCQILIENNTNLLTVEYKLFESIFQKCKTIVDNSEEAHNLQLIDYEEYLKVLCNLLYKKYEKSLVLLVDEFDFAITQAITETIQKY
jgi:hypothetical protein